MQKFSLAVLGITAIVGTSTPALAANQNSEFKVKFDTPIISKATTLYVGDKISLRVAVTGTAKNLKVTGPAGWERKWSNVNGVRTAEYLVTSTLPAGEAKFEVEGSSSDGRSSGDELVFIANGPTASVVKAEDDRSSSNNKMVMSIPGTTSTAIKAEDGLRLSLSYNRPFDKLQSANSTEAGTIQVSYSIPMENNWSLALGADYLATSQESQGANLNGPGPRTVRPKLESIWSWQHDRIALGTGPNLDQTTGQPQNDHQVGITAGWERRTASSSIQIKAEADVGPKGIHNYSLTSNGVLWLGKSLGPVHLGLSGDLEIKKHLLDAGHEHTQLGAGIVGGFDAFGQGTELKASYLFGIDGKSPSALLVGTTWRPNK